MFLIDWNMLSTNIKSRRAGAGLRETSKVIGNVSPSTLSRIESKKVEDVNVSTLLAICNWLSIEPSRFIYTTENKKYSTPELSLADQINILIRSSELTKEHQQIIMSMIHAGIDASLSD